MSEQGWKAFLAANDLQDWVVLHGGPTTVFITKNFIAAANLTQAISQLPGLDSTHAQITLVSNRLTVRLTREVWNIEQEHIELAREVSRIAASHGAAADPVQVQEIQLAISSKPDSTNLEFWRAVLGYEPMLDDNAIDPLGNGSTVWMQELEESKSISHAMHIDVSVAREHVQARLDAAVKAGGIVVDESNAPAWWNLSDKAGNKVCIVAWPDGAKGPAETN